jgi:hypothetical protein
MHILIVGATKDEAEKIKGKIFDFRFSKASAAYPDLKKVPRDVHAIVAYSKSEENFTKTTAIIDTFDKQTIKVVYG